MGSKINKRIRVVTVAAGVAIVNVHTLKAADGLSGIVFPGALGKVDNDLNGLSLAGSSAVPAITVESGVVMTLSNGSVVGGGVLVKQGGTLVVETSVEGLADVTVTAEQGAVVEVAAGDTVIAQLSGSGEFRLGEGVSAVSYDQTLNEASGKVTAINDVAEPDRVYIAYLEEGGLVATSERYAVSWVVEGATTTEQLKYGATPAWSGATPEKPADGSVTYTFSGWSPEIAKVTGAATYTAQFASSADEDVVLVSNAEELAEALASDADPIKIVLTDDLETVEIPAGKNVEIDLNGNTVGEIDGSQGESLVVADSSGGEGAVDSLTGPAVVDLGDGTTLEVPQGETVVVNNDGTADVPADTQARVVTVETDPSTGEKTTTITEVVGPASVDPTPAQGEEIVETGEGGAKSVTKETEDADGKLYLVEIDEDGDGQPETVIEAPDGGEIEKGTGEDEGTYTLPDGGKVTETKTETDSETGKETTTTTETEVSGPVKVDPNPGEGEETVQPQPATEPGGEGGSIDKKKETVVDTNTGDLVKETETEYDPETGKVTKETETDGDGNSVTKDGDGNITDISAGGEGEGSSTVDVKVGEGGSVEPVKDAETEATTGYEVTGPATVTLPDGTTVEVPAGTTVEVDKVTGEVKLDEGETVRVTTQDEDGNDVTVSLTGPVAVTKETALKTETTDSETGTTTTETVGKDGETNVETKDGEGKLTEVETGGNDGTSTESGEPEAGVKVTAGEGGAIEKDEATGVYTVTGPATITLPTEPATTTIPVAAGETVTVAPDGTVTKVETDPETGATTTETTGKDGNKTTETTAGGEGGGETLVEVIVDPVDGPAVTIEVDGPGGEEPGGEIWGCGYPPGDDVPGVPAEIPEGTYYVSGPATLTVEGGTTVAVESGTVLKVNDDGTIEVPEGKSVTVTKAGGEPETVTGPVTLNADGTTKTTTVDTETGETTTETKDGEGKLTEVETGGNDGTSTESGEPEAGVKVTAGEGGTIEKDEATGVYTVTGPATITLPTEPETTTIPVATGETVTVAPDGTVTKVETDPETGATTTETTGKDGNKTTETKDGEGKLTEVETGGTSNGEGGEDTPGVKVTAGEGGSIVKNGDGTYTVTAPATVTRPDGTSETLAEGTFTIDAEGNISRTTTDTETGTTTTETTGKDGNKTTETKDGEGKLTEVETGGNDGTSTESGEPEAGVKVTAGEGGAIEKDEATGVYTVTGPATITLPTDPETTTIPVAAGETVTVAPDGTVTKVETDPETGATTTETTGKDGNKTTETKDGEGNITEVEAGGTNNGGDGANDAPGVKVTLDEGSTGSIVDKGDGTWRVTGEATITLPTEPETVINVPKGKAVTVDSEGNVIETKTVDGVKTETVTKPDGTVETKVVDPGESGEYDEETTEGDGGALVRKTDKTTGAVVDEVYTPKGGEPVHSGEGGFAGWLDQTAAAEGKAVPVTAIALDAEAEGNGFTITFKPKLDSEAHKEKFTTWFDAMELAGRIKVRVSSDLANLGEATPQTVGKVSMDASADGTEESVTFTVDAATLKSLAGEDAKSAFFQVVVE